MKLLRVLNPSDWKEFIDFPWDLYPGKSAWVPPLKQMVKETLDLKKNPFFQHAEMYPLLVKDTEGKVQGRAVGVIDRAYNEFHQSRTAFFGFFESHSNPAIARMLFSEIEQWSRGLGMQTLQGPIDLSTNDTCGLLIEGFEDPPCFLMNYQLPYYASLIEGSGFQKAKDLLAYELEQGKSRFSERLLKQSDRLKQRDSIRFREIDLSRFKEEIDIISEIYNDAWEKNWGFVPLQPLEFQHKAKEMKPLLDPRLCLLVEVHSKPAAFVLVLPDINQALQKIPDGKLLPWGWAKLWWYCKGPGKKKILNRCRILTLGVKKEFQELGLGPLLYTECLKRGPALGYPRGEASWILEDNVPMCKALERMGGRKTKTYRIYEKSLL